jgi:hypothetical protein
MPIAPPIIPIYRGIKINNAIIYMMKSARQCKKAYSDETLENIESSAPYSNISPSKFHVVNSHIQLILMVA